MNVIAGLDEITAGQILLAGEPVGTLDDTGRTLLRRKHIGFIFQSFNLIPTLTGQREHQIAVHPVRKPDHPRTTGVDRPPDRCSRPA